MSDPKIRSHGTQPPPPRPRQQNPSGAGGHPLPRRTTPEKSITLRHHRRARDATIRTNLASANRGNVESAGPPPVRRNSSGDSHDTGNSDAKKWFDQSNRNPSATFGGQAMEGETTTRWTCFSCCPMGYRNGGLHGVHTANVARFS